MIRSREEPRQQEMLRVLEQRAERAGTVNKGKGLGLNPFLKHRRGKGKRQQQLRST